jgi:8-oxo-dGTP diphosphatase
MADRLYERDPQTWLAHLAEGNAQQPRKRVSADAIIRDQAGRLLLVNPNYKPDWDLPGGMAEANEAPIDAVRRELREELGADSHRSGPTVRRLGSATRSVGRHPRLRL